MDEPKKNAPAKINFETGAFTANGTKYQIEQALSIERYCELQILEKEMAFGGSFRSVFDRLKEVHTAMNKTNFVGAAVIVDSMLRGISKLEEREPAVVKICALFINYEGEDRTKWSNDISLKKINDWKAEGMDMKDFFTVAANSVHGFLEAYNKVTQAISGLSLEEVFQGEKTN